MPSLDPGKLIRELKKDDAKLHAYLSDLIHYEPKTGKFFSLLTWDYKKLRTDKRGYSYVWVGHTRFPAHRLAWFLTHRKWPEMIDHINRVKSDNRLCNLRETTDRDNAFNRDHRKSRHVVWDNSGSRKKRFMVKVTGGDGIRRNYGRFLTLQEAEARASAIRAKLGIPHHI